MQYSVNKIATQIVNARCDRENVDFEQFTQEKQIQYYAEAKDQIEPLLLEYYVAEDKLTTAIKNLTDIDSVL